MTELGGGKVLATDAAARHSPFNQQDQDEFVPYPGTKQAGLEGLAKFTEAWMKAEEGSLVEIELPTITPEPTFDREAELRRVLEKLEAQIPSYGVLDEIQNAIAKAYGLTIAVLRSQRRDRVITTARRHQWFLMWRYTEASLPMIGKHTGGFDHTSVLHGIRRYLGMPAEPKAAAKWVAENWSRITLDRVQQ